MRQIEFTKPDNWTNVYMLSTALGKAIETMIDDMPAWIHPKVSNNFDELECVTVFLPSNKDPLPHEWKNRYARSIGGCRIDGVDGWMWLYTPAYVQPPY